MAGFSSVASADPRVDFDLSEPQGVIGFSRAAGTQNQLELWLNAGVNGVLRYDTEFSASRLSKFCIQFRAADYIRTVSLELFQADESRVDEGTRKVSWALHDEPLCFAVRPGVYHGFQLSFTGGGGNIPQAMSAELQGAYVSPASWEERVTGTLVMAGLIALFLISPGLFLTILTSRESNQVTDLLVRLFPWTILFYLALYVCLWGSQVFGLTSGFRLWWLWIGTIDVLVVLAAMRRGIYGFARMLFSFFPALLLYLVLVTGLTALLTHGLDLPIWELDYSWINNGYTYGAFHAHDSVLHYVNGRAIADNEPFTRYYSNRRLMFYVEDRGILPGVLWGVFRQVLGEIAGLVGRTYAAYAFLAIACNAMLILPVMAFTRRFMPERTILFGILVVSLNAFVLVNYYLAWFKLAAAALFLSGLLILLSDNKSLRNWLFAGFSWGLAANMHAGSALMIPLFFLWQAFALLRRQPLKGVIFPLMLVLVFAVTLTPWSLVKEHFYPDQHVLLISHYLGGRHNPEGLAASARQFFNEVPLAEQLDFRARRVENGLRITEITQVYHIFAQQGWRAALDEWNLREFRFTAFVLYPFLLFAFLSRLTLISDNEIFHAQEHRFELSRARVMFWLSAATLLILQFMAYGRYDPDLTYHLPMALPVLMILVLATSIFHGSDFIRRLFHIWMVFAALRLSLPYW